MVIFVQLRKCHLSQREEPAVSRSSQSIDNLAALLKATDRRQLTSIQLLSDAAWWKGQSSMAAESCNCKTASSDQAMKQQCGEQQATLKPALLVENLFQLTITDLNQVTLAAVIDSKTRRLQITHCVKKV